MPSHGEMPKLRLIGAACDLGAAVAGSALAPELVQRLGLARRLHRSGIHATWQSLLHPRGGADAATAVAELCRRLARETEEAVRAGERFAVVGGDHACAIGTWRGAAAGLAGPLGLIWIDAHLDSHVPTTSPSGALHGMPVACLLGYGDEALVNLAGPGARLNPGQLCLIGAHSYEPAERSLLEWLGVRVFYLDELCRRGLDAVLDEALALVQRGTAGFGLSLDLDAIDPRDAPGVSIPVQGGLRAEEVLQALGRLRDNPNLLGLEIAELCPPRDRNHRTAELAAQLVLVTQPTPPPPTGAALAGLVARCGADNYDPLEVVLTRGEGPYLWDLEGRRYLDMMGAYSAASHGHAHPRLVRTLTEQAQRLTITSRAFLNDRLGPFLARLCELTGYAKALPMNSGAEAVETALKAARKWAYQVKGVPADQAEIIVCRGNFHGRTIATVGLSSEPGYREGFGPFPPGIRQIPYGDSAALAEAIDDRTAAFLVEPIQGEGGIVLPPPGYLAQCAQICRERRVLLLCDEIQTGLGRTGRFLASHHDGVKPDGVMLGKALGGGLVPVSAFLADQELMGVFRPGDHGSTFGGNPLAAAVGLEALNVIVDEGLAERSADLGAYFLEELKALDSGLIREVRGKGLFIGLELAAGVDGREFCRRAMAHGLLTRETRRTVIRLAPPLVIERSAIDTALEILGDVLRELERSGAGIPA
ncbi:ornithine--oxo-acid transaminase [Candidatus Methylocalor cossyra]|uniref:Ornithine--oxo-acid aminotransferase n=1 Tax=Candidatus Methylocalor cossyra TaxID=3108543 RepID=A0ABP1C8G4_9GAMM